MKHFPAALFTGAVIAAVVYADGGHPVTALIVGGLVAVGVWVLAYAIDHKRHSQRPAASELRRGTQTRRTR